MSKVADSLPKVEYFTTHDGQRMAFYTMGEKSRPPVILLHGFRNSSRSWFKEGNRFSCILGARLAEAGYYTIALDLRGHGASAKPEDPAKYTKEQELYDISALATFLGLDRFGVVGYSHGSIEAAKLLTVDKRAACAVLGGIGDGLADAQWKSNYGVGKLAVDFEKQARQENPTNATQLLAFAGVQRGQSVTSLEELSLITAPVLCINGHDDKENGCKYTLADLIPTSRLAWVDGDHATAITDPCFSEQVVSFLIEVYPSEQSGNASGGYDCDERGGRLGPPKRWRREKAPVKHIHTIEDIGVPTTSLIENVSQLEERTSKETCVRAVTGPGEGVTRALLKSDLWSNMGKQWVLGFYGHHHSQRYGCFSNFYSAPFVFVVPEQFCAFPLSLQERTVPCDFSEKAIMLCKAAAMGDRHAYDNIKDSKADPGKIKRMGRQVQGFDDGLWSRIECSVAYEVVHQKFLKVEDLRSVLLSTEDWVIAEATKNDANWGIGLDVGHPQVHCPAEWRGTNMLGWALMEVRKSLREAGATSSIGMPTK